MDNLATQRIVALIDMDCFYCQVEARSNPSLIGKPIAIVQSDYWKEGRFIAVNYEAKAKGVTRFMKGKDAIKACPDLVVIRSPNVRGRTDLTKYRDAGNEVAAVFCSFTDCVQRASVDEAFLDLTTLVDERIRKTDFKLSSEALPNTFVIGHSDLKSNDFAVREKGTKKWIHGLWENGSTSSSDYRLAVGALIVEEIRAEVERKTQFHCSAGIGHNKILSKLVAGLHKPKCQTVLPHESVPELFETLPVHKVRNMGGKFGKAVAEKLSISYMSELYQFSKKHLQEVFDEKSGNWLYDIARGIDHDPVTPRLKTESVGCCKNFLGKSALNTVKDVKHWLQEMSGDIADRLNKDLIENKRRAKLLTVVFRHEDAMSRSCPLTSYQPKGLFDNAFEVLKKFNRSTTDGLWDPPLQHLGISASKFSSEQSSSISSFFKTVADVKSKRQPEYDDHKPEQSLGNVHESETKMDDKSFPSTSNYHLRNKLPNTLTSANDTNSYNCEIEESNNALSERLHEVAQPKKPKEFDEKDLEADSYFVRYMAKKQLDSKKSAFENAIMTDPEPELVCTYENIEPDVQPGTSSESEYFETCPDCNEKIHLSEYLEHLDYHTAQKLDRTLNGKLPVKTVTITKTKEIRSSPGKKRRRINDKPSDQHSIKSFFNPVTN